MRATARSLDVAASAARPISATAPIGQIEPQHRFAGDREPVELQVEGIEGEVQRGETERADAENPAATNEARQSENAARGTDQEDEPQQAQRPVAADADRLGDRARAEAAVIGEKGEPDRRRRGERGRRRLLETKGTRSACRLRATW